MSEPLGKEQGLDDSNREPIDVLLCYSGPAPNTSKDDLLRDSLRDHLPNLSHSNNGDELVQFVTLAKYN